jgi:hypothetical protein
MGKLRSLDERLLFTEPFQKDRTVLRNPVGPLESI